MLHRDAAGLNTLGPRVGEWARSLPDPLLRAAEPVLTAVRDECGESAQLYRRDGGERVCVAVAERASGLRTTVPLGTRLPLTAGSGAQVICAWSDPDDVAELVKGAAFSPRQLAEVRRRGWAQSIAQREPGVASVSAPVLSPAGELLAALSISGPVERLGRNPGAHYAPVLVAGARRITAALT
jgi:DNA-binding IclR family transcriptional regulator